MVEMYIKSGQVGRGGACVQVKGSCHVENSENIASVFTETFLFKADFCKL